MVWVVDEGKIGISFSRPGPGAKSMKYGWFRASRTRTVRLGINVINHPLTSRIRTRLLLIIHNDVIISIKL